MWLNLVRILVLAGIAALPFVCPLAYSQAIAASDQKPVESDLIVATVWPNGYSEVKWTCGDKTFNVVSNIDFRIFPGALSIDTPTKTFFPVIIATTLTRDDVASLQSAGALDARNLPISWPATLPVAGGAAQCAPVGANQPAAADNGWQVIQALLDYFNAHSAQLAYAASQRQQSASPPPKPPPPPVPPVVFKRIEHPLETGGAQ